MLLARCRKFLLKRLFNIINARRASEMAGQDRINERPIEYAFALDVLSGIHLRSVVDVGSGQTAFPALLQDCGYHVTAIDNIHDYWPQGMYNRHYVVQHDDILASQLPSSHYDCVTCISVVEHIVEHARAVTQMTRILKPGGHLIMTFPYHEQDYVQNAYTLPDSGYGQENPYICQVFSRNEIGGWLRNNPLSIYRQDYWRVFDGTYWTCGHLLPIRTRSTPEEPHQLTCVHFSKRLS